MNCMKRKLAKYCSTLIISNLSIPICFTSYYFFTSKYQAEADVAMLGMQQIEKKEQSKSRANEIYQKSV